jgi:mannose-6-phosphate isomerase-like protein (cupin superfamily)
MTEAEVSRVEEELLRQYPGAHVKVTPDRAEIVAEIGPGRAVAVIERSLPHFHRKMTEIYRGLKGMLYVACGGRGYVLEPGDTLTVEPGNIHFARSVKEPAWIEVLSNPDWTPEDHQIL